MSILLLLWQVLLFFLVLSVLVFVHEFGHYIVARLMGVHVEEFGFGYPPLALKLFTYKGTVFTLNWIPFGGFVRLEGEEEGLIVDKESAEKNESKKEVSKKKSVGQPFYSKSRGARMAVILAGATFNFLFGILAFAAVFSMKGIPEVQPSAVVSAVAPGSPAEQAKIPVNSSIYKITVDGKDTDVKDAAQIIEVVKNNHGKKAQLWYTVNCSSTELACNQPVLKAEVYIRRLEETPNGQGSLGLQFDSSIQYKFYPWYQMPFRSAWVGVQEAVALALLILKSLVLLFTQASRGQMSADVAGPVGIFTQARQAGVFSEGLLRLLHFAGLISINLAIMNVLPIPALDGGHAFFILLEPFVKKEKLEKMKGLMGYGLAFLIALTVLITIKDVRQLFIH